MHNLIEPPTLIGHFLVHPPSGFSAAKVADIPVFTTPFDLLTTMEPAERRRLESLPLHGWWRKFLRPNTLFVGATVTEYALFPPHVTPNVLVQKLLDAGRENSFLIIKDIPQDAMLVGDKAHAYNLNVVEAAQAAGFVMVEGQALAYVPIDFDSVETFLARMSKSRRKDITRKLKKAEHVEIEQCATGDSRFLDDAVLDTFYALYRQVYDQSEIHFDLLSPAFFRAVLQDASNGGVIFSYKVDQQLIGYNLCFVHKGMLLDKYVGFSYPAAREHNLYFVSWMNNLQYCLEHGLTHYVAGWTDPEIKRHLGASFTFTRHAVYVRNRFIRTALRPFKRFFEADSQWHDQHDHPAGT